MGHRTAGRLLQIAFRIPGMRPHGPPCIRTPLVQEKPGGQNRKHRDSHDFGKWRDAFRECDFSKLVACEQRCHVEDLQVVGMRLPLQVGPWYNPTAPVV